MNAPQARGEESFMKVQSQVFKDEMAKEGASDEMAYMLMHMSSFRKFARLLPDDLVAEWDTAESIATRLEEQKEMPGSISPEEAMRLQKLEAAYKDYHDRLVAFIDSFMADLDPETRTSLTEAIEEYDVDRVSSILVNCLELLERQSMAIEE